MVKWLSLAAAIVLEVAATLSLKGALQYPALYLVVLIGYAGSFFALFISLSNGMNLGVGYGIWGASGVALTALLSAALFDEPLTARMMLGITVIIGGVLLVELGSQAASRQKELE